MESFESNQLEKQRQRRRRVMRIRNTMLISVVGILLFLVISCILLMVRTIRLEKEIASLQAEVEAITQSMKEKPAEFREEASGSLSEGAVEENTVEGTGDAGVSTQTGGSVSGDLATRKAYLTFDDGPSDYTREILDTLDQYQVKATFFVIGKTDEDSLELYREIAQRGHTLAMHSYSHKYSGIYESGESFEDDLVREMELLQEACGQKPWLYRFPGGSSNTVGEDLMQEFIAILEQYQVSYVDWNVSTGDATNSSFTVDDFMKNVEKDIGKYENAYILMHDTNDKQVTREALDDLILYLQKEDIEILPITTESQLVQHVSAQSIN